MIPLSSLSLRLRTNLGRLHFLHRIKINTSTSSSQFRFSRVYSSSSDSKDVKNDIKFTDTIIDIKKSPLYSAELDDELLGGPSKPRPHPTTSYLNLADTARPTLDLNIPQLIDQTVTKFGDSEAIVSLYQNIRKTYSQLKNDVDAFSSGLLKLGIKKGDRIGIYSPNSYEWVVTQLASFNAGFVLVNVHPSLRELELGAILKKAGVRVMIMAEETNVFGYYELFRKVVPEIDRAKKEEIFSENYPLLKHAITISKRGFNGCYQFDQILSDGLGCLDLVNQFKKGITKDDICSIQFISGASGEATMVMQTHHGIINEAYFVGSRLSYTDKDKLILLPQLAHSKQSIVGIISGFHFGSCSIISGPYFDSLEAIKAITDEKCTVVYSSSGMQSDMLKTIKDGPKMKHNLDSLRAVLTSEDMFPEPERLRQVKDVLEPDLMANLYGSTYLSPVIFQSIPVNEDETEFQTYGTPLENTEIKIIDDNGKISSVGLPGELHIKGYGTKMVTLKQLQVDENDSTIDHDGWLKTGDIFEMTKSGSLTPISRAPYLIFRDGDRISTKEIENFLENDSRIDQAQVFAVPDKRLGEEVAVWIKLKENVFMPSDEVKKIFADKLSPNKIPRYILFTPEFPLDPDGKIHLKEMKEKTIKSFELEI